MKQRKLFFGIPITGKTCGALAKTMDSWVNLPLYRTDSQNFHVTIYYLGFVEDMNLPEICAIAEEATAKTEPFDIEFSEIVLAPENRKPSMIWLRGEASKDGLLLQNALGRVFSQRHTDKICFRPHVTLARLRRKRWDECKDKPAFPSVLRAFEPVSSLTLYESVVENGKRKYVPIDDFPFGE